MAPIPLAAGRGRSEARFGLAGAIAPATFIAE
ncbi:hypothetical protein DSM104299_00488 [Baekduia alba]|nr:hypothetical protein DSM104299_00488 [Baekduia alba]